MLVMMAGLENRVLEQPRIDKVKIVHAGESIDETIRPLAVILEEQLKLGEQAEYVRAFKPGTDIATHLMECICNDLEDETLRMVIVVSEIFFAAISNNSEAHERIKNKILAPNCNKSSFALVSPRGANVQLGKQCITLSSYAAKLEDGALAEAIYQQWFGPRARLTSQAEMSMTGFVNSSTTQEDYAPNKVKIIHAMNEQGDKQYWTKMANAIDTVANPENTTQSRLRFKMDRSIAQTVLGDVEGFQKCVSVNKINAVCMWCHNMLRALDYDISAKAKVIDIVCRDTKQQKLYSHFVFGVTRQQMIQFSPQLWAFLEQQGHHVVIELKQSNVEYNSVARTFLGFWAGSTRVSKNPEESSDPTMENQETTSDTLPSQYPVDLNQLHPHQNKNGDRLVMNGASVGHSEANLTQQKSKALTNNQSSPQGRMVTSNGSWDPQIHRAMDDYRICQSDGLSNPPGNFSHHTLRGLSLEEDPRSNQEAAPVRQPMPGSNGQNKRATGSIDSVPVDSVTGPKTTGVRNQPITSDLTGQTPLPIRGAISLPASGGQGGTVSHRQPAHQPTSVSSRDKSGKNKLAASGFPSHSMCSSRSDPSITQSGMDQGGNRNLWSSGCPSVPMGDSVGQGDHLSVQQNPVRLTSDAEDLNSEDDLQLAHELRNELGATASLSGSQSSSFTEAKCRIISQRSMPSITSARGNFLDDSQSDGPRQPNGCFMSAPEGRNPMLDGRASTMSGSQSLPYDASASSLGLTGEGSLVGDEPLPPEETPLSELDHAIIRGVKIRLDPVKPAVADWQELASYFGVPNEEITYWRGLKSDSSPTEQLLMWLKATKQHLTVKEFKDGLEKIVRRDVLKFLVKNGY